MSPVGSKVPGVDQGDPEHCEYPGPESRPPVSKQSEHQLGNDQNAEHDSRNRLNVDANEILSARGGRNDHRPILGRRCSGAHCATITQSRDAVSYTRATGQPVPQ